MIILPKTISTCIATSLFLVSTMVTAAAPTPMEPEGAPPVPVGSMLSTPGQITAIATAARFYGNWRASLVKKDPSSGNLISIKGTVQYKIGNTFSTQIEVKISGMKDKVPFALTYKLWTKGTWSVKNNTLTETTTHVKSIPTLVQSGQNTVNIAALPADKQTQVISSLPNLDGIFPKNIPEASKIINTSANKLTINSEGQNLVLTRVATQ